MGRTAAGASDQMTSRQRIMAAIRHQPHDRVPVCSFLGARSAKLLGTELLGRLVEETDPHWHVGIGDQIDLFLGKRGREGLRTYRRNDDVHSVLDTPAGELHRVVRVDTERSTTWGVEDFFKAKSDVEKFLSIPFEPAEPDPSEFMAAKVLLGDRGMVMAGVPSAICLPAGWFDPATFNIYSLDEKQMILDLVEAANERVIHWVTRAAELGVDYFWMAGPEYVGPPLMHPRCYEVFALPFDKKVVAAAHAHGAVLHTHMHGKVRDVLAQVARSGTDVVSPVEAPPMGNIEIRDALAKHGKSLCIMGNLDDYAVIGSGDLGLVRQRAEAAVHARNETGGGLLLGGTDGVVVESRQMAEGLLEMAVVSRLLSEPS